MDTGSCSSFQKMGQYDKQDNLISFSSVVGYLGKMVCIFFVPCKWYSYNGLQQYAESEFCCVYAIIFVVHEFTTKSKVREMK